MIFRSSVNKVLRTLSSAGMLASAVMVVSGVAGATVLNVSGGGALNFGNLSVQVLGNPATGCINFYNSSLPDACNPTTTTPGTATFSVNPPIDSALFVLNSTGNIKDLPAPSGPVSQFITTAKAGGGTISFDLLNLITPGAAPCPPGSIPGVCTIGPFVFTAVAGGSNPQTTVSFSANLCGYTDTPGTNCSTGTPYTGVFSAQFTGPGSDVSSLITKALSTGITDSVSATLSPNLVPEPGTTLLLGSGLLFIGMAVRRLRA